MTGEITLRGKVLPVGGIKEKVLGRASAPASRPSSCRKRNEKDLEDVPEKVRQEMTFDFVDTIDEVLEHALEDTAAPSTRAGDAPRRPRAASV